MIGASANRPDRETSRCRVSVVRRQGARYPDRGDYWSPSIRYPEYRWPHISMRPNAVYDLVRASFAEAGLDAKSYGTPEWNPLGEYIRAGSRVFVLCNFVYHRRAGESEAEFQAKCTHGSVLRPVLDYVLKAVGDCGQVAFGNAPLQSCDWDLVMDQTGGADLADFYSRMDAPVAARDLRMLSVRKFANAITQAVSHSSEDGVEIDLGPNSLLTQLPHGSQFCVNDYSPQNTAEYHSDGRHVYVVNRHILQSDVVVSVPKLKTHEKVGLTCCLKGFVGTVALKSCLAHHRRGGPRYGGDEIDSDSRLLNLFCQLNERSAGLPVGSPARVIGESLDRILRRLLRRSFALSGAWPGNDTAWRMVLDLARILETATPAGKLLETPVRRHLALVDAIVAGEGEGPLSPTPRNLGTVIFSDDVVLADWLCAEVAGFDPRRIPLLREAFEARFQGASTSNGIASSSGMYARAVDEIRKFRQEPLRAPRHWRGVCYLP